MKKFFVATALAVAFISAQAADIVDTAVAAGNFTTLVAALKAAGLVETLKGPGPYTVFAPNDEAFAKIPKAKLDKLLSDKEKLTKILTYHVVSGKLMATDIQEEHIKTLEGSSVKIKVKKGKIKVNKAHVIKADIAADNGVIHEISSVLMPD